VQVSKYTTVRDLKRSIREKEAIPEDLQRLLHLGKPLDGDSKNLQALGICNESTVHVAMHIVGGMEFKATGDDGEYIKCRKKVYSNSLGASALLPEAKRKRATEEGKPSSGKYHQNKLLVLNSDNSFKMYFICTISF
jgi:hypothetical protein